jgi:hypothetical protein
MLSFNEYTCFQQFVLFCESLPIPKGTVKSELKPIMGKEKRKHSIGVGQEIAQLGLSPDAQNAAYFHDYVERGGDVRTLIGKLKLSPLSIKIIKMLTGTGDPLQHMMKVLYDPDIDDETKNLAILVKIADRINNLDRRTEEGKLTKKYLEKSRELLIELFKWYSGDLSPALTLRKRLRDLGIKIKKKYLQAA